MDDETTDALLSAGEYAGDARFARGLLRNTAPDVHVVSVGKNFIERFLRLLAAYRAQEAKATDAERKFQLMLQERERFAKEKLAAEAQLADLRAQVERQAVALRKIAENDAVPLIREPGVLLDVTAAKVLYDAWKGAVDTAREALPLPPDLGERK